MAEWDVMGEAGYVYVERFLTADGRVAVPTTRNPGPAALAYSERLRQSPDLVRGQRRLTTMLQALGVTTVDTCIGYQTVDQQRYGEHVACGDTGAAIYANSVFGARTNFEPGPAALATALTRRTPAYGLQLAEHRRANVRGRVESRSTRVKQRGPRDDSATRSSGVT